MNQETRLKDLYKHLIENGYDVYFPSQKMHECLSKYIVVKYDGASQYQQFSTDVHYYSLLLYVPSDEYSSLIPFITTVKATMKKLFPMFVDMRTNTQSYYDDFIKGHMVSLQYRNLCKFENQ